MTRRRYDLEREEDEDESYDDRSCNASRKRMKSVDDVRRAKKRSASDFFDLECEVDNDEDEDDEEEGEDGFIVDGGADLPDEEGVRMMHQTPLLSPEDEQEDVEALERRIQAIYAFRSSHTNYDDEETTDVEQLALVPSIRDPKLWMVKCATGHEREVAVCLMKKCIEKGSKLQIRSAISVDHLIGYIYVEADKEVYVKEACKGMRSIYIGSKILLVPIKEMTNVLSVENKAIDLSRDTWVRMKIGTYKGDLAKVMDVDNVRQRVRVKLIPRIDLQALANKLEGREVPKKNTFSPPPRRFMNVDEAREMHIRVELRRDPMTGDFFENINGMMFKDGFFYKTVSMKSISTQNVQPSFDELEEFRREDGDMASLSTLFANFKKGHFLKGDRVSIVKGDLKNLKGWVEKVDEHTVHIKPNAEGLPKTLAVNERELCKYFESGNHVKVVSGAREGATGMVLTVQGHLLNVVSDATKEVFSVFSDDVVESSEVAKSQHCMAVGGSRANGERNDGHSLSRFAQHKTPPCIPQSLGPFSRGGPQSLVGKSIQIRLGTYKGYKGRVISVKGTSVRVELESQMKVITVDRQNISPTPYRDAPGSETPMHPSRTPLRPYMTTPMRDTGATPVHQSRFLPLMT